MTMTKTCLSQQNIIIEPKDGYESRNLFIIIIYQIINKFFNS